MSYALAIVIAGAYAVFALRGPQGVPALMEKWDEVHRLEQENADLQEKIREKRARIERLEKRPDELELEIRQGLNQVKPGEKVLILPDAAPTEAEPATATPSPEP
jgi:cell division protein FtsB